jgi:hypothetical protein
MKLLYVGQFRSGNLNDAENLSRLYADGGLHVKVIIGHTGVIIIDFFFVHN